MLDRRELERERKTLTTILRRDHWHLSKTIHNLSVYGQKPLITRQERSNGSSTVCKPFHSNKTSPNLFGSVSFQIDCITAIPTSVPRKVSLVFCSCAYMSAYSVCVCVDTEMVTTTMLSKQTNKQNNCLRHMWIWKKDSLFWCKMWKWKAN